MNFFSKECFCNQSYSKHGTMQCNICLPRFSKECLAEDTSELYQYQTCDKIATSCTDNEPKLSSSYSSDQNSDFKPIQTGTPNFINELKSRHFSKAEDVVKYLKGPQLTIHCLQTTGFDSPILINKKDGLEMTVPSITFSLHEIEDYIGGDKVIDVIDVTKQKNFQMRLKEFIKYFKDPIRSRILNVISLEFSHTRLSALVEAPYIVRKLDWVNSVWPKDWPENDELKKPEVQKYCLMGVKDSFTDFHIDFGGTSVWYHIVRGEKIFYFIRPTQANLQLYQQWMSSSSQSETFFGDQVDTCYKCILKQGQTMLIPTGWIHAVLTSADSLVFGGNFLHNLNIPMQIHIYEMEKKMKTPTKFQYPGFESINWFAAKRLLKELKDFNTQEKKCSNFFLQGIKALLSILKVWNTEKDYKMSSRCQIPEIINSQKLLKDLSKEIRNAGKFLLLQEPQKSERESQRKKKKKKKLVGDFIDFNTVINNKVFERILVKNSLYKNDFAVGNQELSKKSLIKLTLSKSKNYLYNRSNNSKVLSKSGKKNCSKIKKCNSKVQNSCTEKKQRKMKNFNCNTSEKGILLNYNDLNSTVLRLKQGSDKVNCNPKNILNAFGNFMMDSAVQTRKELTWKQSSIYDFHDSSNESNQSDFSINNGQGKIISELLTNPSEKKLKIYNEDKINDKNLNKNGIDNLLEASFTLNKSSAKFDNVSDRASPSTREAIAGMLSFSTQCYAAKAKKGSKVCNSTSIESECSMQKNENDLSFENLDKVHQDEDFIYPAFDVSDDDEFFFKNKSKKEKDEAWSPKVKVGPLVPKLNRPSRERAKKASVEKGLEAAAKKLVKHRANFKRVGRKNRIMQSSITDVNSSTEFNLINTNQFSLKDSFTQDFKNVIGDHNFNFESIFSSDRRLNDVKAKLAASIPVEQKSRKGMKTAKQRLGKILKINKILQ